LNTNIANLNSMKVNQNRNLPSTAPVSQRKTAAPTVAPATAPATTDFAAATQLTGKLAATPEVRADQVARAQALIADPNYPNAATISKVACQLADKISPSSSGD
jgi:hypothetical protein